MATITLTELAIRALKTDAQTDFWDTSTPGFGIRIGPKSKTFVLKHENRRHTLGRWPEMTLKEARDAARATIATKHTPLSKITFYDAADRYVELYCKRHNKPSTAAETQRLLKRATFPGRLDDLTLHEIQKFLNTLPKGEANHCFAAIRALFNWCIQHHYTKY